MAILLDETDADACIAALEAEDDILISAASVTETLIVAARRGVRPEAARLIDGLGLQIVPVTAPAARRAADAHARWGKGVHPAGLNFGDCFAYDVAKAHDCPLLFVGEDFARTDLRSARSG